MASRQDKLGLRCRLVPPIARVSAAAGDAADSKSNVTVTAAARCERMTARSLLSAID